jgi:hypothetical protein
MARLNPNEWAQLAGAPDESPLGKFEKIKKTKRIPESANKDKKRNKDFKNFRK